ncbi:MAG TPA: methyltransferase domain-containing protein [Terracidiphilus sp.]|nr:methyltransferase domain-containing protein [Terracidiphilus sp.]
MAQRVCPWWMGYLLISPIRRLGSGSPERLLAPYLKEGMTVLEPGPGMGFFTLPMARMVGPSGHIVVVDIQPKMLEGLRGRAAKAGLLRRIEMRLVKPDSLGIDDLKGSVDFVLAFAMVHELPSTENFFRETANALKAGGKMLLSEPAGHVTPAKFGEEIDVARQFGFAEQKRPVVRRSLAAVLVKKTG